MVPSCDEIVFMGEVHLTKFKYEVDYETEYQELNEETGEVIKNFVYMTFVRVISGTVYSSWFQRHEEGHSSGNIEIEEGENEWFISQTTSSCDCDGPLERYNYYISQGSEHGPRQVTTFMFLSPLEKDPNRKSYQRDVYAERMGY